jgi:type I restriction enzyme S subunit
MLVKPAAINQDIKALEPEAGIQSPWALQMLKAQEDSLLKNYRKAGTTVESLDSVKLRDYIVCVPSSEEQRTVGGFFTRLDNLISLHQRELEVLQNAKQAFLTKMFV